MKTNLSRSCVLALAILLVSVCASAHHGVAAYDTTKQTSVTGIVRDWFWANPHCILQLDATDSHGQVTHWTMETSNPADLVNIGWSKQSLKVGDKITVTIQPAKNGKPIGRIVEIALSNGQRLRAFPEPAPHQ
jgi:hypothetical protein